MTPDNADFLEKMILVFTLAGFGFMLMMRAQKRKEEEADRKFERTMQLIELRNRKYDDEVTK